MAHTTTSTSTFGGSSYSLPLLTRCCAAMTLLLLVSTGRAVDAVFLAALPRVLSPPFALNSTYTSSRCVAKYSCTLQSDDVKECSCHPYCYVHNSCCADRQPPTTAAAAATTLPVDPRFYTCVPASLLTGGLSTAVDGLVNVYVVNRCPPGPAFDSSALSSYCSNPLNQTWNDTMSAPVTHAVTGVTYRNLYCALCNGVTRKDLTAWTYQYNCNDPSSLIPTATYYGLTSRQGCFLGYQKPAGTPLAHDCRQNLVQACTSTNPLTSTLIKACSNGATQYVYDLGQKLVYRNRNCASCSQQSGASLSCASWPVSNLLALTAVENPSPADDSSTPAIVAAEQPPPQPLQLPACPVALPPTTSAEERVAWLDLCPNIKVAGSRCNKKQQKRRK